MASLSIIAVPVFLDTNGGSTSAAATQLVRQWARTYDYGHIILPGICIGVCGLYGHAVLTSSTKCTTSSVCHYAMAAATTVSMVPFTWLVMTSTNNALFQLQSTQPDPASLSVAQGLIIKWAWMHVARCLFPLLGAFFGVRGILRELSP